MLRAKVPRARYFHRRFPLTPALSPRAPRERENRNLALEPLWRLELSWDWPAGLPLPEGPEGEGRGEGEKRIGLADEVANSFCSPTFDSAFTYQRFLGLGGSIIVALLR